ncbi:MAG: hypothetical protein QOH68_3822 [Nocardioidaceae bacterium]|nr:hypothetical protein [Nocardioidaceae bacterium]
MCGFALLHGEAEAASDQHALDLGRTIREA